MVASLSKYAQIEYIWALRNPATLGAGGFSDLVRDIAESPVSQEEESYPRFEQIGYNITSKAPLGCPSRQIVKADRPDLHRCIAKRFFVGLPIGISMRMH
jgi:hypothetical protein